MVALPALRRVLMVTMLLVIQRAAHAQATPPPQPLPEAPSSSTPKQKPSLLHRPVADSAAKPYVRPVFINGRPYMPPTQHELLVDYLNDSYGLPALARTGVRTLYNYSLDQPKGWDQDFTGFAQRLGSNAGITAINGNVRYAMEEVFHEDLRYIPCHGCGFKRKVENALLAEITARHAKDGHRFFTLTPTIADFSGPIIARTLWYPAGGQGPLGGVIATRTVFATRVGSHLFREFVLERRHHDAMEPIRPPRASSQPIGDAGNPQGE
jgi:hypothetical protein